MDELRELLEAKLRDVLARDDGLGIKDIKDAAQVLRELREMEQPDGPAEPQGGVIELG